MSQTSPALALPEPKVNQPYIEVSALEAGMLSLPLSLVFDLGLSRNFKNWPPVVLNPQVIGMFNPEVPQAVDESLRKGGIDPMDVETIVLSHLHFDHIGEPSAFPKATFVLGPGSEKLLDSGYPKEPQSDISQDTVPRDRTRFLTPEEFDTAVGPFPRAYDYFGDGSLYLIDAAGHLAGHINVLARTSADGSWIYLGADMAHDMRLLTGEKEIAMFPNPMTGHLQCVHANKEVAAELMKKVGSLLEVPRVHVLLAHDREWYEENKDGDAFLPGIIPPKL